MGDLGESSGRRVLGRKPGEQILADPAAKISNDGARTPKTAAAYRRRPVLSFCAAIVTAAVALLSPANCQSSRQSSRHSSRFNLHAPSAIMSVWVWGLGLGATAFFVRPRAPPLPTAR
jgi:hypothetical protein